MYFKQGGGMKHRLRHTLRSFSLEMLQDCLSRFSKRTGNFIRPTQKEVSYKW